MALLSPGRLLQAAWLGWPGAVLLGGGLGAHLAMLAAYLRHGRRCTGLFTVFVLTSVGWLLAGTALALAADLIQARRGPRRSRGNSPGRLAAGGTGRPLKVITLITWTALSNRTAAGGRREIVRADRPARLPAGQPPGGQHRRRAARARAAPHRHASAGSVASLGLYRGVAEVYGLRMHGFPPG